MARQLDPDVHVDVHAALCGVADEAGSKTINLPADATIGQIAELMDRVCDPGLKGLTVFRDGCLDVAPVAVAAGSVALLLPVAAHLWLADDRGHPVVPAARGQRVRRWLLERPSRAPRVWRDASTRPAHARRVRK